MTVSIKVSLIDGNLCRFSVDKTISFAHFHRRLPPSLSGLIGGSHVLKYTDDEGDAVTINNERDLHEALALASILNETNPVLRAVVITNPAYVEKAAATHPPSPRRDAGAPTPFDSSEFVSSLLGQIRATAAKAAAAANAAAATAAAARRSTGVGVPTRPLDVAAGGDQDGDHENVDSMDVDQGDEISMLDVPVRAPARAAAPPARADAPGPAAAAEAGGWLHAAVCDSCQQPILGIRYKCGHCNDFDLCEACESAPGSSGHNPKHVFLKLRYGPIVRTAAPLLDRNIYEPADARLRCQCALSQEGKTLRLGEAPVADARQSASGTALAASTSTARFGASLANVVSASNRSKTAVATDEDGDEDEADNDGLSCSDAGALVGTTGSDNVATVTFDAVIGAEAAAAAADAGVAAMAADTSETVNNLTVAALVAVTAAPAVADVDTAMSADADADALASSGVVAAVPSAAAADTAVDASFSEADAGASADVAVYTAADTVGSYHTTPASLVSRALAEEQQQQQPPQQLLVQYDEQLSMLSNMGFPDQQLCRRLLAGNGGDILRTIADLLDHA